MSHSTSETGHTINVANFDTLITYCTALEDKYKPTNEWIKISNLQVKYDKSYVLMDGLTARKQAFDSATNDRQTIFEPLETTATSVFNSFIAAGGSAKDIDDLRAINVKIQGPNYYKSKKQVEKSDAKSVSTSQQSFVNKAGFFKKMIQFVESKSIYNPNEEDIKVDNLWALHKKMEIANKAVDKQTKLYNEAKNARDKELYDEETGLVTLAKLVKNYIKSVFKANSPEFKEINSIAFKVIKNK